MNEATLRENVRSLAAIIGGAENEAGELLAVSAAITVQPDDSVANSIAEHVKDMLSRTLRDVGVNRCQQGDKVTVELIVGNAVPRFNTEKVYVAAAGRRVLVSTSRTAHIPDTPPSIALLLASCYTCALALKIIVGARLLYPVPDVFTVDIDRLLGPNAVILNEEIDFDEAFLAGAGAIGNGFILGLSKFRVRGKLHIIDDDTVGDGNLQRCLFFTQVDIGKPKADTLAQTTKQLVPHVTMLPQCCRLQDVTQKTKGPWLKRLVVGVDSPRARRSLQNEMPCEVFDASTTGAEEIVLHFHQHPTEGACLACAYQHSVQEDARERHIAESLGVSVNEVHEQRVSAHSAMKICAKYPYLKSEEVEGAAFDTLFKALCSSSKLYTPEGQQVLTPFAFVSVLAGAMLALEFVRRVYRGHSGLFNDWRISPWNNPIMRRQQWLGRASNCEFCGNVVLQNVVKEMWGTKHH
jgi:molybdopterin/thiamine biosynthesis adenylyltransferase